MSGNRVIFGESVQGESHKRTGTECQDSFGVKELPDGTVILAAADGHGSKACPFSKTGSGIAVSAFCDVMEDIHGKYLKQPDSLMTYLNREGETSVAQAIDLLWEKNVLKAHKKEHRKEHKKMQPDDVYTLYGTTLLGLMIAPSFLFAYQLGDGDITYACNDGVSTVLIGDKFLGTDTHSLSSKDSWKQAVTVVRGKESAASLPHVFMLSTDGFANSHKDESEFHKTCGEYFDMIKQHGAEPVRSNLAEWLAETSKLGCGDDITLLLAYFW